MTTPRSLLARIARLEAVRPPSAAQIGIVEVHKWPDALRDAAWAALDAGDGPAFAALVKQVEGTAPPVPADGGVAMIVMSVHPDRRADWIETRHLTQDELDQRDAARDRADRLAALPAAPPPDPDETVGWNRRGEPVTRADVESGREVIDISYGVPGPEARPYAASGTHGFPGSIQWFTDR